MDKGDEHEVTAFVSGEDCTPADTGNVLLTVENQKQGPKDALLLKYRESTQTSS